MPAVLESPRTITQFRALSSAGNIDADKGVIYGASILTIGPAVGHKGDVDEKGLEQALTACREAGEEGVNLVIKHEGEFEDIVGGITNFRRKGLQLLGDIHLDETSPYRARVLEIAQKRPSKFGLSVESYPSEAGWEKVGNKKMYRCTEMVSVAIVPEPASNPKGLFSRGTAVDTSQESTLENMEAKDLTPLIEAALKPLSDKLTALETKVDDKSEQTKLSAKLDEQKTQLSALPTQEKIGEVVKAEVEKAVKEQAPQIAADAVTKFAATTGVKPGSVPNGQMDDPTGGDKGFEGRITTHLSAMPKKDRGLAIQRARRDDPEGYNKWTAAGSK